MMNRKDFIESSLKAGLGWLLMSPALLSSCSRTGFSKGFKGKVSIVGAGAAGLSAGHLLQRHGVDFEIIEAAPVLGGRMKRASGFADFPIDLGAEWIHTDPEALSDIVGRSGVDLEVDHMVYNPKTIQEPVSDKLFFAGEALSINNQAAVHGACESAFEAVSRMLMEG